jgi:hypothetical protein
VLWLDDLERFLGPVGLTPALVAGLTTGSAHGTIVLATMRTSEYERFVSRAEPVLDDQGRAAWRAGRDVLRTAEVLLLDRLWTKAELQAAAEFADDPRIAAALQRAETFGVAETLAPAPSCFATGAMPGRSAAIPAAPRWWPQLSTAAALASTNLCRASCR